MLDVVARQVVIIGGGAVATRKAKGLLAAGAQNVRVVSPAFHPDMPPQVERVPESYHPMHLSGAGLVFAATDAPEINDAVVRDAGTLGLLVCRADADDDAPGDFTTPAVLRRGPVAVMVSAAGAPALAAAIRDDLADKLDPRQVRMAEVMQTLRPILRGATDLTPARRRDVFRDLASPDALESLASGGAPMLLHWIARRYPDLETVLKHVR